MLHDPRRLDETVHRILQAIARAGVPATLEYLSDRTGLSEDVVAAGVAVLMIERKISRDPHGAYSLSPD
jgi:DNA-binding IclR family transcriptional regulator